MITIPAAVIEAGARAIYEVGYRGLLPENQLHEQARAAFLAMIDAWEGMRHDGPSGGGISQEPLQLSRILLPLTEKPND